MLQVTEKANEMIKGVLEDKDETSCIRVYLSQGG